MRPSSDLGPEYWEFRRRKIDHNLPFDVQRWSHLLLPSLEELPTEVEASGEDCNEGIHTFPTYHFPLSFEESVAFVHHFRVELLHNSREMKYSDEDRSLLSTVESRIQKLMDANPSEHGYFVRLGSRSPKDAVFWDDIGLDCCERLKRILFQKLCDIHTNRDRDGSTASLLEEESDSSEIDPFVAIDTVTNREMVAIMVSSCEALKVDNASQAMEMLKHSQRVYSDLLLLGDFEDLYEEVPMELVIRKWMSDMPYEFELRGFVKDNKLNALSQYDNTCYFPNLVRQKEEFEHRVKTYFDTFVAHRLEAGGFSDYVCDIGIRLNGQCIVIELNSFDVVGDQAKSGTGASLFSWKMDSDILLNGPYEFRVIDKPPFESLEGHVPPDWLAVVTAMRDRILAGETEYGVSVSDVAEEQREQRIQEGGSQGGRKCTLM